MRVGYSKLGRSWQIDPHKGVTGSGDIDVRNALDRLANAAPHVTWVLNGRNSGETPRDAGLPDCVENPWVETRGAYKGINQNDREAVIETHRRVAVPLIADPTLDHQIVWAGQHGMVNSFIPLIQGSGGEASPQISFVNYAAYLLEGLGQWRDKDPQREEMWLIPDVRNYLKARDLKWPVRGPILAQYTREHNRNAYRYGDPITPAQAGYADVARVTEKTPNGCWSLTEPYAYSAVELTALDHPDKSLPKFENKPAHDQRYPFGILVNETRWLGKKVDGGRVSSPQSRVAVLKEWVLTHFPDAEIFGVWSDASKEELGRLDIRPCPLEHIGTAFQRWRCTLTTPASGSGWATAKPWESFSFGTVCFKHPKYDDQGHIYGDRMPKELREWLVVPSAESLAKRVQYLTENPATWQWIVDQQRAYFVERFHEEKGGVRMILDRLGLL